MQRSPSFRLSLGVFSALTLLAPACDEEHSEDVGDDEVAGEQADLLDPPKVDPGPGLAGLDRDFADAATQYDVPTALLQAISHVETRWEMIEGLSEFEGQEPAFGVMALRGEQLRRGAELAGYSIDKVKTDRRANLRAGAALLSAYADELAIDRADLGAWAPVVARFSGIPETLAEIQANYVHNDVYALMRTGVTERDLVGNPVAKLDPIDATPDFSAPLNPKAAAGPDYAASVWRPSPNYSSRPAGSTGTIKMVIIHSCEGAYSGCWGWLVNPQAGVSAHYVVKEDGSEISQLVKEANKAWHIGASYDCKLNSGKECQLNGYSSNNFTIGIEHAGYAKQASWNSNLINNSAKLVCDMSKAHAIPRDKYHVVAHGQLQPYNRIDPGPNWPWATYLAKINEYCGAVPPPAPPPADPVPVTTIIVDSNNANNDATKAKVAVSANWTSTASTPGYYGSGYWYATTSPVSDAAEFSFYLSAAATRTVDAWWTAGTNRSATAPFVAFNAQGTKLGTVNVNQQTNGGKWVQLGTFNFTAGWNKVVLSRWTTEGKVVIADAVRIR